MSEVEAHCTYKHLENGIHHLIFTEATRKALDECLGYMDGIYKVHPPAERLMFMFDLRLKGLPPLNHVLRSAKKFYSRIPVQPETRAAYLYKSGALISLGQTFLDLLGLTTERRFYTADQEAEAVEWLLEKE